MGKDEFARELMLQEIEREQGRFVTTRIVDRLIYLYNPMFDRQVLALVAERLNAELATARVGAA